MWNQNISSQISHYITEVETNPQAQGLLISENFTTLPSKAVETLNLVEDRKPVAIDEAKMSLTQLRCEKCYKSLGFKVKSID